MKYGLKGEDYFGLLYSGREFGESFNRVLAGDLRLRLNGGHGISVNGIATFSREAEAQEKCRETRSPSCTIIPEALEHDLCPGGIQPGFPHGFGLLSTERHHKVHGLLCPELLSRRGNRLGVTRVTTQLYGYYSHNRFSGLDDVFIQPGLRFNLKRNSYVELDYTYAREGWMDRSYDQNLLEAYWGMVPARWLTLNGSVNYGTALRYDFSDPFLGKKIYFRIGAQFQPNDRISQSIQYTYQDFHRADDNGHVFDLNMLVSRTTYQFNKSLFVRALVQYDSYSKKVLTDLLASFTLIPGTVLYLGYGSMYREQYWDEANAAWKRQPGPGRYYQTTQSVFIKASYLWRF